jgi:Protein metal binding site.
MYCMVALAACGGGRTSLRTLDPTDAAKAPHDGARVAIPDLRDDSDGNLISDVLRDWPYDGPCDGVGCNATMPASCAPGGEICNGIDDDCDGVVDNDIAPIPCPGGGFRYCVAGQMSSCPTRCPVCVPGGQRVCFISYCSFWGLQTCASDGQSWGYCVEQRPVPSACASVAGDKKHSPATEQCCIDNGFCCLDEFDLNHNGDTTDLLGRCGDVLCVQ